MTRHFRTFEFARTVSSALFVAAVLVLVRSSAAFDDPASRNSNSATSKSAAQSTPVAPNRPGSAPQPALPPAPAATPPAPPATPPAPPVPPAPAGQAGPRFPGLGDFMRPEGIALPGGVGFIRPGADRIGIQINTRDGGVLQFDVPRRSRSSRRDRTSDEPPPAGGETDAPKFGGQAPAPDRSTNGQLTPLGDDRPAPGVEPENRRAHRKPHEYTSASQLFRAHNLPSALRRVDRGLQRHPADPDLSQLRSLIHFAMGDYRSSARDALDVLATGDVWDWPTLRSHYRSADEYTAEVRSLEKDAFSNPNAIEPRLVLGYHYLMLGHRQAARRQFERVAAVDPGNETARRLLQDERPPGPAPEEPRARPALAPATPSAPPAAPAKPGPTFPNVPASSGPFQIELGKPEASGEDAANPAR